MPQESMSFLPRQLRLALPFLHPLLLPFSILLPCYVCKVGAESSRDSSGTFSGTLHTILVQGIKCNQAFGCCFLSFFLNTHSRVEVVSLLKRHVILQVSRAPPNPAFQNQSSLGPCPQQARAQRRVMLVHFGLLSPPGHILQSMR